MNRDDIIRMAREAGFNIPDNQAVELIMKLEKFANLVFASREPMSDEQLKDIIEYQSRLTGWKIPPTIQVARLIEHWHGIGDSATH
jgi:hypothetical protein